MKKPDPKEGESLQAAETIDMDGGSNTNGKWDISRLSAGEISALRRSAGTMMNDSSMRSHAAFYRAINPCKSWQKPFWFASLCMQCLWREADVRQVKSFPEMLHEIYQDGNATDSTRKKCLAFLDYTWENDGFLLSKICRLVKRMRVDSPKISPDFEKLADDLSHWNNPDRYVQKRWIRTICLDRKTIQDEGERGE